jgi:aspartate/methionine/tyrosine aminotransferase
VILEEDMRAVADMVRDRELIMLADLLLEEGGVAGLNGGAFGDYGEGYIRFSYANSLENLMEAVARIEKAAVRWKPVAVRG